MRDGIDQVSRATDALNVGVALADAASRVGFGSFSFVPFQPGLLSSWNIVVRSSEFPTRTMRECCVGAMLAIEHDLGGLAASFDVPGPKTFDVTQRFPRREIEHTRVFQDYWRPYKLQRQLVASMHAGPEPLGFMCVARGERDRAFTAADLDSVELLRSAAERALLGFSWLGSADLTATLGALGHAFPAPAFLFAANGALQWMSHDAALRLGIESARVGSATIVRGNRLLEAVSKVARIVLRDPSADPDALLRRAGVLRNRERVVARRFDQPKAFVLLAVQVEDAAPYAPALATMRSAPRMGAVELRVARLAAEGNAVLNIASQLGIAETTVRTHLRRVYAKLGVHNRAELACALLVRPRDP